MDRQTAPAKKRREEAGACLVCGLMDVEILISVDEAPVHCNLLWTTRESALSVPRGEIRLGFCRHCGHIFNLAFDPELVHYTGDYENSLHFSPRFQAYAESLAARLIERYGLRDKDIIEIGSGKGEFLTLLCELGGNRGVGFDPSYVPGQDHEVSTGQIAFVEDFYSERHASYPADFICSRHVLEHIADPVGFLTMLRRTIGGRSIDAVFFEVPNGLCTLRDLAIWDIIYEHCSYFSPSSLSYAFRSSGFEVCELDETFDGQFLGIDALPGDGVGGCGGDGRNGLDELSGEVEAFADQHRRKVEAWRNRLAEMAHAGQRAVVWGGGSKGVTFLNLLQVREQIPYVVDINPRKQGMYVAGSGQQIVPPEFLWGYRPDVVIVMNEIYRSEIARTAASLGLAADLICA